MPITRASVSPRLAFALAFCASCSSNDDHPSDEPSAVVIESPLIQRPNDGPNNRTLLLEEGVEREPIVIATLSEPEASVDLTIQQGPARFDDGLATAVAKSDEHGVLTLPRLVVKASGFDSEIRISSSGVDLGTIRLRVLPAKRWGPLDDLLANNPAVALQKGTGFVVVDESVAATDKRRTAGFMDHSGNEVDGKLEKAAMPPCPLGAFGGIAYWAVSNPWGYGYSVKPEDSWNLVPAANVAAQKVDGVYKRIWGCNAAIKIADSCAATFDHTDVYAYCCNAALQVLGHTVQLVNPGNPNISWPWCPL